MARSFRSSLISAPPLSSIIKPPNRGYEEKYSKPKPFKNKESSEDTEEEHQDQVTSQAEETASDGVSISSPPDGASIAESKPVGLAIAGPGGVASSKPQGTAIVGAGGLAIAKPVGTAIAGVNPESTSSITGHKNNKKKPKNDTEAADGELHYVGGLTGPIGHPKPVAFGDFENSEKDGSNVREKYLFRSEPDDSEFQFKLGQKDDKYGLIGFFTPSGTGKSAKKVESSTFFHGLLGNNGENFNIHRNHQFQ